MLKRNVLVLTLCLLAGCATAPPVDYYTLDMTRAATATPETAISIAALRLSDKLRRDAIYIQVSPTEAEYYGNHAWAAGLDELIREKLMTEFGLAPADAREVKLRIDVLACGQVDTQAGPEAYAKLHVAFFDGEQSAYDDARFERVYERRLKPASDEIADLAATLSQALSEIAAEIVADAKAVK